MLDSPPFQALKLQEVLAIVDLKLKRIINKSRPGGIGRLPNAILTKIFHILVDLPFVSAKTILPAPSMHWIAITHVCTHWRELALSTPSLWTHVLLHATGGNTTFVDAFITRSGNLPLTITLGRSAQNLNSIPRIQAYCQGFRHIVKSVSHRIARMVVEPGFPIDDVLRADRLSQRLAAMLSQPMLVRTVSSESADFASPPSETEDSLSTLLHSTGAQLRHLELFGEPALSHTLGAGAFLQHLSVLRLLQASPAGQNTEPHALSALFRTLSNLKHT